MDYLTLAFAGAGYILSKSSHRGYEDEIKRHNLAMEKWYGREVAKK